MKHFSDDMPIRASLLDRLQIDSANRSMRTGRQDLKALIRSVHEHLESLLNTRWRAVGAADGHDELRRSLINYGIPDFVTNSVASPEGQIDFQELVAEAIRLHEPRFLKVKVEISDTTDAHRTLHFRIRGELYAQPETAQVTFDSMLDPSDQRIRLKSIENV